MVVVGALPKYLLESSVDPVIIATINERDFKDLTVNNINNAIVAGS